MIKKSLSTGLAILLPIIVTGMIVSFLVNFMTKPFLTLTHTLLNHFIFFQHSFLIFSAPTLMNFASKTFILLFLFGFTLLLGLLGKLFLIDYLLRLGDYCLHNIPFINKIYKACQDVVHSLFSSSSKSFSQVVLVPFPNAYALSIGLVTTDVLKIKQMAHEPNENELIPVFVPGTPNPSVGFMLLLKKEQLIFVNMRVDEAMKFVVSCGVVMSDFETKPLPQLYEKPAVIKNHLSPCERQCI